MPLYVLKIKCDLENLSKLFSHPGTTWKFDVESDSGETREGITFCAEDVMELDGSRGTANFIMKWHSSGHQTYIKIVDLKKVDGSYKQSDSGSMVSILGLECRGLHPTRWIPGNDFQAESSGGKIFEEVDMTEGDWAEYDDENDLSVSVMSLEHTIEKI